MSVIVSFGFLTHSPQLYAQVSFHTTLIGHLEYEERASDIWGYVDDNTGVEYAIIGLFNGISIIDVSTDPANPVEVSFIPGPSTIWRDIKTYSNYAFVINQTDQGLQIIDLSDPENAFEVTSYTDAFESAHNLYIDAGFAYVVGTNTSNGGITILDLADPEAPSLVGTWSSTYIHDVFVRNNTAYAAAIGEGGSVYILDVTDKSSISQIAHISYPDGFSHNTWTSDDGQYLYTTDELSNGPLRVWDISDLNNISQVGEYRALSNTFIHNILIKNSFGFISYYVNGLRIVDLSDPSLPVEVGFYDTFLGPDNAGFDGYWGIYPFAPSGNLYMSDFNSGFYLVAFDSVEAGELNGTVTDVITGLPIPEAEIHFLEANKFVTTNEGGEYIFNSAEGEHRLIATANGYLQSDTLLATLSPGGTTFDLSLELNLTQIAISLDTVSVSLNLGETVTTTFEITNAGSGPLDFTIRDINGPLGSSPSGMKSNGNAPGTVIEAFSNFSWSSLELSYEQQDDPIITGAAFNFIEILSDPVGDMLFGTEPDVISVQTDKTSTHVLFRIFFAEDVDTDSAAIILSLDTDQNFETNNSQRTNPFGVFDIGAEYDVLAVLPGIQSPGDPEFPPLTLFIFNNTNGNVIVVTDAVSADSNMIEFAVPLSSIGDDDGNMDVAGYSTYVTFEFVQSNLDLFPNMGHGIIGIDPRGDPGWLSVSPTSGQPFDGESSTIEVSFVSDSLADDTVYTALLLIESVDPNNPQVEINVILVVGEPSVGAADNQNTIPVSYALMQNYPNPFNPQTTIQYAIPLETNISLVIYNLKGQEVMRWEEESVPAGYYEKIWDGATQSGISIASGVYLYRLQAGDFVQTKKMVLLK